MTSVLEAPIIHGVISVASCIVDTVLTLPGGTEITAVDSSATSGSTNLITSGAVFDAVQAGGSTGGAGVDTQATSGSTNLITSGAVFTAISNIVDSAPGALNTLNEIAAALNDDDTFHNTVVNELLTKQPILSATNRLDASFISNGSVSNTTFGHLSGTSGNIQTQIDAKLEVVPVASAGTDANSALSSVGRGGISFPNTYPNVNLMLRGDGNWHSINLLIPDQTGKTGYILSTNGQDPIWKAGAQLSFFVAHLSSFHYGGDRDHDPQPTLDKSRIFDGPSSATNDGSGSHWLGTNGHFLAFASPSTPGSRYNVAFPSAIPGTIETPFDGNYGDGSSHNQKAGTGFTNNTNADGVWWMKFSFAFHTDVLKQVKKLHLQLRRSDGMIVGEWKSNEGGDDSDPFAIQHLNKVSNGWQGIVTLKNGESVHCVIKDLVVRQSNFLYIDHSMPEFSGYQLS